MCMHTCFHKYTRSPSLGPTPPHPSLSLSHIHAHVHACTRAHMRVHTHTHTHTYTHTHKLTSHLHLYIAWTPNPKTAQFTAVLHIGSSKVTEKQTHTHKREAKLLFHHNSQRKQTTTKNHYKHNIIMTWHTTMILKLTSWETSPTHFK